jgi:putative transposase
MKRKQFSSEQIWKILQINKSGIPVAKLKQVYGFSESTFYRWKERFSDSEILAGRRRELEEENTTLRGAVAALMSEINFLRALAGRADPATTSASPEPGGSPALRDGASGQESSPTG